MDSVSPSSDLHLSTPPAVQESSTPKLIFTVLGALRTDGTLPKSYAANVVNALSTLLPEGMCKVFSEQEARDLDIDWSCSVALFDHVRGVGLYSGRHAPRFPSKDCPSIPPWAKASQWAFAIHRDVPRRVAEQLAVLLWKKFNHNGLLSRQERTKKKRKPRPRRGWKGARPRSERYSFA